MGKETPERGVLEYHLPHIKEKTTCSNASGFFCERLFYVCYIISLFSASATSTGFFFPKNSIASASSRWSLAYSSMLTPALNASQDWTRAVAPTCVHFGCAWQPAPIVVMKSIFPITSINGFKRVGLSHPEIIGQHFFKFLRLSSSSTRFWWRSSWTFSNQSASFSGIVPQDCSKICHCSCSPKILWAAVTSSSGLHAIFPTHAVPVWIPDAPANLANLDNTNTVYQIGFSGLVNAPCHALWKWIKTSGYFLLSVWTAIHPAVVQSIKKAYDPFSIPELIIISHLSIMVS